MWKVAWQMVMLKPIIGLGLHTFSHNYMIYCPAGYPFYKEVAPYAHNIYMQMLAETGFLGLSAFLAMIFTLANHSLKAYHMIKDKFLKACLLGLWGCMIAYLTHGLLESSLYTSQGAVLFWLLLGLMMGLNRLISNFSLQKKDFWYNTAIIF